MILKGYLFSILYAILCIGLAIVFRKLGAPKKYTRKLVHILVGFEWVILLHYMGAGSLHFLAVCILFTLLLFLDYRMKLVPAMSSEGENAPGTVYYAVAMTVMATIVFFVPDMVYAFGIGVFCTSFGDGFAAVVGQSIRKHNPKIFRKKSLFGTLTNLIVCFFVPLVISNIFDMGLSVLHCLLISLLATELELFTGFGLDNIIITVGISLFAYFLCDDAIAISYLAPIFVTPLIIVFALGKKALTFSGVITAIILDLVISLSLANFGFTILITFFALSIVIDKVKKALKKKKNEQKEDIEKKGDCRDFVQVLANGLSASVCAALYFMTCEQVFIIGFVASLAEAFADTSASGLGSLSGRVYDPFRMKRCEAGESGGMSLLGTGASLVAAFSIAFLALAFGRVNILEVLIIGLAAFLGGIFDSLLGSLVQVKFRCKICGRILEKEVHCGEKTEKYRGFALINNDAVNIISTAFSALLAMLVYILV